MSDLYERIDQLCKDRKINITTMCKESGASRGSLTDLKFGRKQNLSIETLSKIAEYFGVSVDYLTGKEKAPASSGKRVVSRDELKIALFRGREDISDAMMDEVLAFADLVALREEMKKAKE